MKSVLFFALVCAVVVVSGCSGHKTDEKGKAGAAVGTQVTNAIPSDVVSTKIPIVTNDPSKLIITPSNPLIGKVSAVNLNLKFVVLTFPVGYMPAQGRQMNLFRQGLKVGEVKISGPQNDDNIVADLTAGNAQLGDEAR